MSIKLQIARKSRRALVSLTIICLFSYNVDAMVVQHGISLANSNKANKLSAINRLKASDNSDLAISEKMRNAIKNTTKYYIVSNKVMHDCLFTETENNFKECCFNNAEVIVKPQTESKIRDVDMAAEMVSYSKNNILAQAGAAMLKNSESSADDEAAKIREQALTEYKEQQACENQCNKKGWCVYDNQSKSCKYINLTQHTYNVDKLDYRNVDLSPMTEQQACDYWKGTWEQNTCTIQTGKGRFKYLWQKDKKKFRCLNEIEAKDLGLINITDTYYNLIKEDIQKYPNKWNNAEWDPVIEECGSQHERDCRDAANAWDFTNTNCYYTSKNKEACERIGAKFNENEYGIQTCDCVSSNREFHWKSGENFCTFKISGNNGSNEIQTGSVSGTQNAVVESCLKEIEDYKKNQNIDFFQGQTKLNCQ